MRVVYRDEERWGLRHLNERTDSQGDTVSKVSVVPRVNGALGFTLRTPPEDRSLASASDIRGSIAVLLAGRAAEKLAFDEVTTGASDDLQRATRLAEQFVGVWGMSDAVGPRALLPMDSAGSGAASAPAMGRPGASSRLPSMEQGDHEVSVCVKFTRPGNSGVCEGGLTGTRG